MQKLLSKMRQAINDYKLIEDGAVETLMLAISYEGRINCFSPKTLMDKNIITLIRPMVYIHSLYANIIFPKLFT